MATATTKMRGSKSGAKSVPRELKRPTKSEARTMGENGAFALHLWSILDEKNWTKDDLLNALTAARLDIADHAVRAWLRGENMPKASQLRAIGRAIGLDDSRHILPPDRR